MNKKELQDYYQVNPDYIEELYFLQVELLKLQKYIFEQKLRVLILFEGRDTAGKGRAIFRFTQFLNPRLYKIIALGKPTEEEKGQWYFQRYLRHIPNAGQFVFFDRSWYNRAVVEPVMEFCTEEQYQLFVHQVNSVEKLLDEDGVKVIKFWFSIDYDQQKERIARRMQSPLMQWKVSPVDQAAQKNWEKFTKYKEKMFEQTSTDYCPWLNIKGKDREDSRIQAIRYTLSLFDYHDKSGDLVKPNYLKIKKV